MPYVRGVRRGYPFGGLKRPLKRVTSANAATQSESSLDLFQYFMYNELNLRGEVKFLDRRYSPRVLSAVSQD